MRFRFPDGTGKDWAGVITLARIDAAVREYLECDENDLPEDVAVPPRQMEMPL